MMKKITMILLVLAFAGCGKETDADKIGAAQACLDALPDTPAPTSAELAECTDKIAGLDSSGAQNIFCSAGFIREGFGNLKHYTDAFKAIDTGTGQNQQQNMMGLLSFTSTSNITTDTTNAQTNFNYCLNSGSKGATILAAFSSLSMGVYGYIQAAATAGGGSASCPASPTQSGDYKMYPLADCIGVLSAFPPVLASPIAAATYMAELADPNAAAASAAGQLQVSIGNTILSTNRLSCSSGGNANNAMCDIFKTAIGNETEARPIAINFFKSLIPGL